MTGMDEVSTMGPARALLTAVYAFLDEHYPHWRVSPRSVPEGLRVEMHPQAVNKVLCDPYMRDWPGSVTGNLSQALRLPVKVTADLPEGEWRLVVVAEDVKLGGKL